MRIPEIIPECYIDTAIVESLMNTDGVNHQKGCNNVARTMQTARHLKDSFAIGIIDKDKREPSYVQQFTQLGKTEHIERKEAARKPPLHCCYTICRRQFSSATTSTFTVPLMSL